MLKKIELVFMGLVIIILGVSTYGLLTKPDEKFIYTSVEKQFIKPEVYEVKGTCYNPVTEQCDVTPLITADNNRISLTKLKAREIRWVAVSRDLLADQGGPFYFGDTMYVFHQNDYLNGAWIVRDCMGSAHKRKVDFLMDASEKRIDLSESFLISNVSFYTPRLK